MAGYVRQSAASIVTGADILAAPLSAEFNQLQSAFNATTGHGHSGGTGDGPKLALTAGAAVTGILPVANGGTASATASDARTALGLAIGTNVQAQDAGLQSIAGLTTAADTMIYTTALDTYTTATLSSFARTILDDTTGAGVQTTIGISAFAQTLLDDGDAATARTTLGLSSDFQPLDATLTAFAAYNTNGLMAQTGADTFTGRTIVAPGAGITIANGNGVGGNPTLSLANDLGAIESLTGTNTIYYRSATSTWTPVTIGSGLDFTAGTLTAGSSSNVVGSVLDYAGLTEPSGWLFCYGQAVSRVTYLDLFTVLSTTYGVGDGSTTFNLPDCRGRVVAGQDDMGGSSANRLTGLSGGVTGQNLGAVGGLETHTLVETQTPSHDHSVSITSGSNSVGHTHTFADSSSATGTGSANHTHTEEGVATTGLAQTVGANLASFLKTTGTNSTSSSGAAHTHTVAVSGTTGGISANHTHLVSGTTGVSGSNLAHNNVQPTLILNKIIYTGV